MRKEIIEKMKTLRNRRGWSQAALAIEVGVAPSTISMYESGQREPDLETIEKIADALGVSIQFFFDDVNDDYEDLKEDERELLEQYRKLNRKYAIRLLSMAYEFADKTKEEE